MNDKDAAEFYGNPNNLRAGRRVTPPRGAMSGHVPVRFSESTIEQIKSLATADGVTVSTWIRRVVDREIKLRVGQYTAFEGETRLVSVDFEGTDQPGSTMTHTLADSHT